LLLLIVVGFAVGMVAGLAWEEPGLVLAHLTGETEEVAWSAQVAEGQATRAAEAPPRDDRPADPQIRRKEERAATAETPAVAAAPVGRLAVQVGAFKTSRAAEHLATGAAGHSGGGRKHRRPAQEGGEASDLDPE
jgi:hypothetical protein